MRPLRIRLQTGLAASFAGIRSSSPEVDRRGFGCVVHRATEGAGWWGGANQTGHDRMNTRALRRFSSVLFLVVMMGAVAWWAVR